LSTCTERQQLKFLLNVWESSVDENIFFSKKDVTSVRSVIRWGVNYA
jgi:hypothetical protein